MIACTRAPPKVAEPARAPLVALLSRSVEIFMRLGLVGPSLGCFLKVVYRFTCLSTQCLFIAYPTRSIGFLTTVSYELAEVLNRSAGPPRGGRTPRGEAPWTRRSRQTVTRAERLFGLSYIK
ncbi:hypothetical protein J6590_071999 [Homalodisca vitripennis]|nr:hypothetical protein J6590_071999 [Homalodisca vitripennis]